MYYGCEHGSIPVKKNIYPGIETLDDLYRVLSDVWCAETCTPRMREQWSKENRTLGQCSITSFLVQDLFDGEVYGILLEDGNYHCFNVIEGIKVDLTSEQFTDQVPDYEHVSVQKREEHFRKEEKYQRYLLLKDLLRQEEHRNA